MVNGGMEFTKENTQLSPALPSVALSVPGLALGAPVEQLRARYLAARPFPHLVIDQLFPAEWLHAILEEYRTCDDLIWKSYDTALQKKKGTAPDSDLPPVMRAYFDFLQSAPFLRLLSEVTGIANLLPDPSLYGGGLHVVSGGGHFDLHVDFQKHPTTGLCNRLVVITYLNEGWEAAYGGNLELWGIKPSVRQVEIVPCFGRTVLMSQSAIAAHGHPSPIRAGMERKSVIAYFYTGGKSGGALARSSRSTTVYVRRPGRTLSARLQVLLHDALPSPGVRALQKIRHVVRNRWKSAMARQSQ